MIGKGRKIGSLLTLLISDTSIGLAIIYVNEGNDTYVDSFGNRYIGG